MLDLQSSRHPSLTDISRRVQQEVVDCFPYHKQAVSTHIFYQAMPLPAHSLHVIETQINDSGMVSCPETDLVAHCVELSLPHVVIGSIFVKRRADDENVDVAFGVAVAPGRGAEQRHVQRWQFPVAQRLGEPFDEPRPNVEEEVDRFDQEVLVIEAIESGAPRRLRPDDTVLNQLSESLQNRGLRGMRATCDFSAGYRNGRSTQDGEGGGRDRPHNREMGKAHVHDSGDYHMHSRRGRMSPSTVMRARCATRRMRLPRRSRP